MPLTITQAQSSSRINRIAGSCPTSADWLALLNDADRMLVNRGNFWNCVVRMTACVESGCVVWPREVLTPLAMSECRHPVTLQNHWFSFNPVSRDDFVGYYQTTPHALWGHHCRIGEQGNETPVWNPITNPLGVYVRLYPSQPSDVGKNVTIFGVDSNGQELRSKRVDGTFQDGIQTTLSLPFATVTPLPPDSSNVSTIRHITRGIKDLTDGPVRAYQYDAVNDVLLDLATWGSSETNPAYQTTRIGNHFGSCIRHISALVSLKHIDVVNGDDTLVIENVDALAMAMQALKLNDAYDPAQKRQMEADAIRELNLELRKRLPIDQCPLRFDTWGTATLRRAGVGCYL